MRILIVEDELIAQKSLERTLLRLFPDTRIVGTCRGVMETVNWLEAPGNVADVIFMDVELSDGNCFEIFRKTKVNAKVVMTTAYDSYAIKAFEAGSIDYLLKPIDPEALRRAVGRCRMNGGIVNADFLVSQLETKPEYKERFLVHINDRIVPVDVSNIAYIYSEEKNNYLMTFDGQRYVLDASLDVISEELDPAAFFKISRSCVLNSKAIKSMVKQLGGRFKIVPVPACDFEMTVSRSRADDFLKWLER